MFLIFIAFLFSTKQLISSTHSLAKNTSTDCKTMVKVCHFTLSLHQCRGDVMKIVIVSELVAAVR